MADFDFKQVFVTFTNPILGAHVVTGFAEGDDGVVVERDEDKFVKKVGADGEHSRSKSNNQAGSVTINLMATSASNDWFSAVAALDDASGDGVCTFLMKDGSGRTLASAAETWIKTEPSDSFGKESGDRAWVWDTGALLKFTGGNT